MSVTIKHLCYDKLMHTYYCYGYTSTVFDQHRQVVSCPDHTPSCGRVVCMGTRLNRQGRLEEVILSTIPLHMVLRLGLHLVLLIGQPWSGMGSGHARRTSFCEVHMLEACYPLTAVGHVDKSN